MLVAVSKEVFPEKIKEAVDCGIRTFGENRVQDAAPKILQFPDLQWHMIGHLQTNKVKKALELFSMIQSVDSLHLGLEIDKRATSRIPILVEVNTSGEQTKFGVRPQELSQLVEDISGLSRLDLQGLMTIGPGLAIENPEASRKSFQLLRELRDNLQKRYLIKLPILSMGMSSDYEIAIEEGSTMLRIGTLIFGTRQRP